MNDTIFELTPSNHNKENIETWPGCSFCTCVRDKTRLGSLSSNRTEARQEESLSLPNPHLPCTDHYQHHFHKLGEGFPFLQATPLDTRRILYPPPSTTLVLLLSPLRSSCFFTGRRQGFYTKRLDATPKGPGSIVPAPHPAFQQILGFNTNVFA